MIKLESHLKLFGFIFLLINLGCTAEDTTQIAFEINEPDLIPEGIAFDQKSGQFFIGSTYKRKIVSINEDGTIQDFVSSEDANLLGVLGMKVDPERRCLWVLSSHAGDGMPMENMDSTEEGISRIHKFNIDTKALINQFELGNTEGRNFLNDLTIANSGSVFITDTQTKRIYRIQHEKDSLELFFQMDSTMSPNGIDISNDQRHLFLAVYGGKNVVRLELETKNLMVIEVPNSEKISADGLYFYKNSLIAVQPWNEDRMVSRFFLDEEREKITTISVLENESPHFSQPTTAVLVGNHLYCIANSQLQVFRRLYNKEEAAELVNPILLKIPLN